MAFLGEWWSAQAATWLLVLARIAPVALFAPLFGTLGVPFRVRVLVGVTLTALVAPLAATTNVELPEDAARYLVVLGGEALVGLMLALSVRILFAGLQLAGQLLGQASGLQIADVFAPGMGANLPVLSYLLVGTASAVFLVIGGHRRVIEALLDTFVALPVGRGGLSDSALGAVVTLVTQSFSLGIRAAAPVLVALLAATLVLGLVARVVPQLSVLAVGLGGHALLALLAIALSLGGACWVFHDQLEPALATALSAIRRY